MKHKFQRILSVVLCVCMMLSYLPSISVAEAAETTEEAEVVVTDQKTPGLVEKTISALASDTKVTITIPDVSSFEEGKNSFYWSTSSEILESLTKNMTYKKGLLGQKKEMVCKDGNLYKTSWDGEKLVKEAQISDFYGPGVYIARYEFPEEGLYYEQEEEQLTYVDMPFLVYPNEVSQFFAGGDLTQVKVLPEGTSDWIFKPKFPENAEPYGQYDIEVIPVYNEFELPYYGSLTFVAEKRWVVSVTTEFESFQTEQGVLSEENVKSFLEERYPTVTIDAQDIDGTKEYENVYVQWNTQTFDSLQLGEQYIVGTLILDDPRNDISNEVKNHTEYPQRVTAAFPIIIGELESIDVISFPNKTVFYTGNTVTHEIDPSAYSDIEGIETIVYTYKGLTNGYFSQDPPSAVGSYLVTASFIMEPDVTGPSPVTSFLYIQIEQETEVPAPPELDSVTDSSIQLKEKPVSDKEIEYGIKDGDYKWQDSPLFENLNPETEYVFVVRYKATDLMTASEPSLPSLFTTKAESYTIRYWENYGTTNSGLGNYKDQEVVLKNDIKLTPNNFVRPGYLFLGWSKTSTTDSVDLENGTTTETFTNVKDSIVPLYAIWGLKEPSVSISTPKNVVTYGENVVLSSKVIHEDATVDIKYQWYKDGELIPDAVFSTLTCVNVQDSGIYHCIASITNGSETTSGISNYINVLIKKATIALNTPISTTPIVYGEPLRQSTISSELNIDGNWKWETPTIYPTVADGNRTSYNVIFVPNNANNYNLYEGSTSITVNPAPLTVKANDATISYGEAPIHNGVEITGLVNGDTEGVLQGQLKYDFDYGPNAAVPEDGTATITPSGLTSPNYNITFEPGVLTVKKLVAVITPNQDVNKEYGDDDPDFTYTVSGLINGDQLIGELGREPGEKVGTYKYTLGTLENRNYELVLDETASKFEILPFSSQVRWEGQDETYKTDGTDQSGKITAFFVNENGRKINLTITFRRNGRITPFNAAGTYTVTATYPDNDGTYQLTNDSLEITMGGLTDPTTKLITFPTASPIEYGQKLSDSTLTGGSGGTNGGGTYQWAMPDEMPTTGRHTYDVIFTPADDDFTDYSGEEGWDAGTGTIIRSISITVNPKSAADTSKLQIQTEKTYDGTNTAAVLGGSAIDIAEGDDVTVKVSATYNSAAAGDGKTITVRITLSGKDASKYKAPAAYTLKGKINKADLILQAADSTIQFGSNIAGKGVIGTGFVNGETVGRLSGSLRYQSATYTKNSPVGTYPLTPYGLTSNNYTITFEDGSLIVEPRKITIKPSTGQNKTEGAVDPTLRYIVSSGSLVASCPLTGALEREPGETVGIYEILQGTLTNEQNPNYNITFVEGVTFRINNANGSSGYDPVERGEIPDPVLLRKTQTSITIQVVTGAEYSIDGGQTWQRNNTFSNLTPDTTYEIIQRWRADGDEPAGEPSNPLPVRTNDSGISEEDRLPAPTLLNKTARTVTLVPVDGAHYSKDGGKTWQNSNVFSGLRPDTEYQFVQRKKPTSSITYPTSDVLSVTTDAIVEDPSVDPDAPKLPAPTLQEKTSRSVTLVPVDNAQYSKDGGKTWQNSNVFSGLRPGTAYEFVQRLKATPEIAVYPTSEALTVVTDTESSENPENPDLITLPAPKLANKTSRTITLEPTEGAHYSKDGGKTWQNSNVFSGLRPDTEYQMVQRIKPTSTLTHPTSEVLLVKTDALVEEPGVDPEAPKLGAPVLQAKTSRSITLVPVDNAQYSKDAGKTWQYSNEFTGLRPGTAYEFVQRLRATPEIPVYPTSDSTVIITDTESIVDPEQPEPIKLPPPTLASKDSTSVTLNYMENAEYSRDGGRTWQSSNHFIGLQPNTTYQFVQRLKASGSVAAHPASEPLSVTTDRASADPDNRVLEAPVMRSRTATTIILHWMEDVEWSRDNGVTWQTTNGFTDLTPDTEYTFVQRYKATSTLPAGPTSPGLTARTLKSSGGSSDVTPEEQIPPVPVLLTRTSTSISVQYHSALEYSRDNGATWQESNTFTNLEPDTPYNIIQRYKAAGSQTASKPSVRLLVRTLPEEVTPPAGDIAAPVLYSKTNSQIILMPVEGAEYSIDNGRTWQPAPIFTGLTAATKYTLIQRYQASGSNPAGKNSAPLEVVTDSHTTTDPSQPGNRPIEAPQMTGATRNTITLKKIDGAEYSRDNGATWQDSNVFSGLTANTVYTFVQRYKADSKNPAGDISLPASFKTTSSGSSSSDGNALNIEIDYENETINTKRTHEYSTDNGKKWQATGKDMDISDLMGKTILVREKENGSTPASEPVTIDIPKRPGAPSGLKVNFEREILNTLRGQEFSDDAGKTWDETGRDMNVSDLMGVTLQVRESATDEEFASASATVRIPARPKAPTVKYTDASGQNMSDGSLSGTNDRMEYSRDGGSTWINITGSTVTNLAPGAYQIRTKATQSAFCSEPAYVQIGTSGQSGTSNPGSNTGSNNGNNGNTGGTTTIPTKPGGTTTNPGGTGGNKGNGSTTGTIQNTPGSSGGTISTGNRPSGTTTTLPSTTKKPETATGTSGSTTQTPNKTQPSGTANQGSKPGATSNQSPSSTVGIAGANVPLASPANANWVFTPGTCPSDYYKDVYQQLWYHDAIDFTVLNRFMIGISADEWAPDLKMTNAMVAQVFYRVVGTKAKETTNKYTDVKQGAWYYDAVAWATNNGIMKNSTTTFGINDEITYEELATVFYNLCNTYGLTMVNGSTPTTVTTPATTTEGQTALTALVNTGIFNVNGNTSISASGSMTRATFAQVLTNFCTSFNSQISANSQIQGATQGIYTNPGVTTTAGVACT